LDAKYKAASMRLRSALQAWWLVLTIGALAIVIGTSDRLGLVLFAGVELLFLVSIAGPALRKWWPLWMDQGERERKSAEALKASLEKNPSSGHRNDG
jgi:hypothetical protein